MDPRISLVTLAVANLAASRRFYVDGLGWTPELDVDDVVMIRVGERLVLSLWQRESFELEVGPVRDGPGQVPVTLAHNVPSVDDVDAVLEEARTAGSPRVGGGAHRAWGGYTGYFTDPDGFHWEVAHNPGPIGRIVLDQ